MENFAIKLVQKGEAEHSRSSLETPYPIPDQNYGHDIKTIHVFSGWHMPLYGLWGCNLVPRDEVYEGYLRGCFLLRLTEVYMRVKYLFSFS